MEAENGAGSGNGRPGGRGCGHGRGHGGRGRGGGRGAGRGRGGWGSPLEPALLAALVARPRHGYDLRFAVEEMTGSLVTAEPGGLYRQLRRLEDEGLVVSSWSEGTHGPQQRRYQVTPEGVEMLGMWREHLRRRAGALLSIVETIDGVLDPPPSHRDGREGDPDFMSTAEPEHP